MRLGNDKGKAVDKIAKRELMERIEREHSRVPCTYTDKYAERIKTVYRRVWNRLEETARDLDRVKKQVPPDLWDAETSLNGPNAFGLRIFRRTNLKPGPGSYQKKKAAKLLRRNRDPAKQLCNHGGRAFVDDHLRANGHFAAGEALQPPETALTLYWKNGKVATTDGAY